MSIKLAGQFRELIGGMSEGESLFDAVSETPLDDENDIIDYLGRGVTLAIAPGIVRDVLQETGPIIGSLKMLTDGVWSWRSDLPYYVKNYHVRLPVEFVRHMRNVEWRIPELSNDDLKRIETEDLESC